ncbi:alkyl hydroperoxide reductase AhpD [Planctomycetales bacterium]|nr:alkyl hydroperoxide reductase AhpD [Planctomycetales bacterium]GHV19137.1 alkyl hydroperoxide reductase AhpD [Planctomycetales bacterium]
MATVKLYNQTGDEKAVKIQQGLAKHKGFVPEVFQAMGRNGDFLEAMLNLAKKAGAGLDPKTKELIAIAVSAVNGCGYCVDAHRAAAKGIGITDEEITAAIEVAAMMSAFNKFNDALDLTHDLKAE